MGGSSTSRSKSALSLLFETILASGFFYTTAVVDIELCNNSSLFDDSDNFFLKFLALGLLFRVFSLVDLGTAVADCTVLLIVGGTWFIFADAIVLFFMKRCARLPVTREFSFCLRKRFSRIISSNDFTPPVLLGPST